MNGFVLTWLAFGLVLALFGARAWVVETNRGRFTTAGSAERGLTAAVAASVVLLVVMLTFNGGLELTDLLLNGQVTSDVPADTAPVTPGAGQAVTDPLAPGVAPAAPGAPVDPNAPAAPANP